MSKPKSRSEVLKELEHQAWILLVIVVAIIIGAIVYGPVMH